MFSQKLATDILLKFLLSTYFNTSQCVPCYHYEVLWVYILWQFQESGIRFKMAGRYPAPGTSEQEGNGKKVRFSEPPPPPVRFTQPPPQPSTSQKTTDDSYKLVELAPVIYTPPSAPVFPPMAHATSAYGRNPLSSPLPHNNELPFDLQPLPTFSNPNSSKIKTIIEALRHLPHVDLDTLTLVNVLDQHYNGIPTIDRGGYLSVTFQPNLNIFFKECFINLTLRSKYFLKKLFFKNSFLQKVVFFTFVCSLISS